MLLTGHRRYGALLELEPCLDEAPENSRSPGRAFWDLASMMPPGNYGHRARKADDRTYRFLAAYCEKNVESRGCCRQMSNTTKRRTRRA